MLKKLFILSGFTFATLNVAVASYDSDDDMEYRSHLSSFLNAEEVNSNAETITTAIAQNFMLTFPIKSQILLSNLRNAYDNMGDFNPSTLSVDSANRAIFSLEQNLIRIKNASQELHEFNEHAANALEVLGNKDQSKLLRVKNAEMQRDNENRHEKLKQEIDRVRSQLEEAVRNDMNHADECNSDEDEESNFQSYFNRYEKCAKGEKPNDGSNFTEYVAYGCYLLQSKSAEEITELFGAEAYTNLNSKCLQFANGMIECIMHKLAGAEDEQLFKLFNSNIKPIADAFAKCFNLELVSEDQDHITKMMKVCIKKLERLVN